MADWEDAPSATDTWEEAPATPITPEVPKTPMDIKAMNKEAAAKGQVYVEPVLGLSASQTAAVYSFAERASTAMRGIGQMLGIHKDETEEEIRKREALEANPEYAKAAKIAGVAGLVADPVTYAIPLGKAATLGQFVKQSALMGGAIGFTGAKTEEESRGKKAIEGAAFGTAGGVVLGSVVRAGGKMFGKDWLPWKATPEEKVKVVEELKKTNPEIPEEQINHFLNAPEDKHINAKNYAEHLINTGASPAKVEKAIKTNPLIGVYLDNYKAIYEHLDARFGAGKETSRLAQADLEVMTKAEKQAKFEADQRAMQEAGAARAIGTDVAAQHKAEALAAQNKALQEAGAARTIPQIIKGEQNAIQERRATEILPRPQEGIGEARGERGGIRPSIQGEETAQESIQKEEIKSFGNKEAGKIDPTLATQAASQISGVVLGAALNPEDPWTGAVAGGAAGYGGAKVVGKLFQEKSAELLNKTPIKDSAVGDFFSAVGEGADKAAGWLATRLENESPALVLHALDNERKIQKQTFDAISGSDKFLTTLGSKLKPQTEAIKNLWLNGDREAIRKILVEHGDKEAIASFEHLTSTHDKIGQELKSRGLIKGVIEGHLPRIVKDREGLLNSMGLANKTAIEKLLNAETKRLGVPLDDVAASNVINKYLRNSAPAGTGKPSFTKTRVFNEITPEMQKYYYDVAESYHTYTSRAINEINTSDFFGKSKVLVDGAVNVDESIGNVLNKLIAEGKIKESQFDTVRNLLETRYKFGNMVANKYVQEYKNWTTGILLADLSSSVQNINDIALASFHYGLTPTMSALAKKIAGKQKLTVEDYGLVNHISEEFISSTSSKRYVDKAMKLSGWSIFDPLGKEIALNASLNRATGKSKSEEGIKWLESRYGDAFGSDFPKLVQDLQKGEQTDLVKLMSFYDVARHQPLTKLQKTELATKNPNVGGLVYQFKSFMLGQANLIRTEVYNEWKYKKNTPEALKKIAMLGMGFAAVGASNQQIQNWLLNKDEKFEGVDIFWNATRQFGLSKYTYEQIKKGEGVKAIGSVVSPPTALASGWTTTNPATGETEVDKFGVVRKIPVIGKEIAGYQYQVSPEEKALNKRIAAERTRIMKSELEARAKELRINALQEKLKREQERRRMQQRGNL